MKFIKNLFLFVMCCTSVSASESGSASSSGELLGTASTHSCKSLHSSSSHSTSSGSTVSINDLITQIIPTTPAPPPSTTTTTTMALSAAAANGYEEVAAGKEAVFYTTDGKERRKPSAAQVVKRSLLSSIAAAGTKTALSAWKAKEDVGIRFSGAASTVLPQMCNGEFSTKNRSDRTKRHQMETTIEELLATFAEKPNQQTSANPHHALLVTAAFILENREMRINEQTRDALVAHFQAVARTATDVAQKLSGLEAITES